MSVVVWKYEVPLRSDPFTLELPEDAQILTVQVQPSADGIMLWALVDPEQPKERHTFQWLATGGPVVAERDEFRYCGTVQLDGGALVFHLFECVTG